MTSSINPETLAGLRALNEPGSNAFFSEIAATNIGDTTLHFKAMWEAQGTGNAAEMARTAHTIKGSSLTSARTDWHPGSKASNGRSRPV